jgi:hypothetical protein
MEVATWWRRQLFFCECHGPLFVGLGYPCAKGFVDSERSVCSPYFPLSVFSDSWDNFEFLYGMFWGRDFPHVFKMTRSRNCWEHSNTSRILYRSSHTNFTYVSSSPRNMTYSLRRELPCILCLVKVKLFKFWPNILVKLSITMKPNTCNIKIYFMTNLMMNFFIL